MWRIVLGKRRWRKANRGETRCADLQVNSLEFNALYRHRVRCDVRLRDPPGVRAGGGSDGDGLRLAMRRRRS